MPSFKSRSRSKSPGRKTKGKGDSKLMTDATASQDVKTIVSSLRANFDAGVLKSYESRVKNLESLRTLLVKGRAKLCAALKDDLGKCMVEVRRHVTPPLHLQHLIKRAVLLHRDEPMRARDSAHG